MVHHSIRPDGRMALAIFISGAGLALAACDRQPGPERGGAHDPDATYVTAAHYGWSSRYGRLAFDHAKPDTDVALLIKVKTALVGEPDLKPYALEVGVLRGVVTLYGEVDTVAQRATAERIARDVQGVEVVKSGIAVTRRV